jgi:hypothetical protein
MLVVDFEGGTESLVGLDIDVARMRSWSDFYEVARMLKAGKHEYKSIGLDSLSEVNRFSMNTILEQEGPGRRDPDSLQLQDWGKIRTQVSRVARLFRDLEMHVFFTSHDQEITDPREGEIKVPSFIPQGLRVELPGMVDICAYLALSTRPNKEGEYARFLLLKNFPKYGVKARTPWNSEIPDMVEDPTVTTLFDALGIGDDQTRRRRVRVVRKGVTE